jgi:hypothetical protein
VAFGKGIRTIAGGRPMKTTGEAAANRRDGAVLDRLHHNSDAVFR